MGTRKKAFSTFANQFKEFPPSRDLPGSIAPCLFQSGKGRAFSAGLSLTTSEVAALGVGVGLFYVVCGFLICSLFLFLFPFVILY